MSSGKTTLGKKLARLLNYRFIDLDKLIEKDQGMDIPSIFKNYGEAHFREIERKVLLEVQPQKGMVIASGGGAPCFFDNMKVINEMGVSVYLDVPAAELARRIESHGKDDRPILSGAASILDTLQAKISEREPFYSQAKVRLTGEVDIKHLHEAVKAHLQKKPWQ